MTRLVLWQEVNDDGREVLRGTVPRRKHRLGLHFTKVERDRTRYTRKIKHRKRPA
jgi:hypothetical protein